CVHKKAGASAPACGSEVESARGRFASAGAGFGAAVTAFTGASSASTTATAPPAAAAFTTLASRATEGLAGAFGTRAAVANLQSALRAASAAAATLLADRKSVV